MAKRRKSRKKTHCKWGKLKHPRGRRICRKRRASRRSRK